MSTCPTCHLHSKAPEFIGRLKSADLSGDAAAFVFRIARVAALALVQVTGKYHSTLVRSLKLAATASLILTPLLSNKLSRYVEEKLSVQSTTWKVLNVLRSLDALITAVTDAYLVSVAVREVQHIDLRELFM